jgi:trehalose 2-sulfotransferase
MDACGPRSIITAGCARSYTIAFAARSGSNEICNLLARNGLGQPSEFFQSASARNSALPSCALNEVLDAVSKHSRNGIFGSKMAHDHRARLDAGLVETVAEYRSLDDVLPQHRWVWLRRRDKVAQAISLCRAEHSNLWAIASTDDDGRRPEWSFDFYDVLSRTMILMMNDLAWGIYFEESGRQPYVIFYEDFFADVRHGLTQVISHLGGLPGNEDGNEDGAHIDATSTLVLQRDGLSDEYRERFRNYLNTLGGFDLRAEFGGSADSWERFFRERSWLSAES